MASPVQSVSIAILVAAACLAIIAVFGFHRRDVPGGRGFMLTMVAATLWSLVVSIAIWPVDILPGYVTITFRNGLITVVVLGWAWLAAEYVTRSQIQLRPVPVGLLLIIPVLTVGVTITNPYHHLAIAAETSYYVNAGPSIVWGPWHFVLMVYVFGVSLVPAAFLIQEFLTAHGIHRRQILYLLAGFVIAFVGVNDYLFIGAFVNVPDYIRIAPFTFLVAGGLWLVALYKHQLFGIVPVSQQTVIETMADPVIAVDESGMVVDLNPAAGELFGVPTDTAGIELSELCSAVPAIGDAYTSRTAQCEITTTVGGTERFFLLNIESIRDRHDGNVIVLREITEQKRYEKQLEQQRDNLQIINQVVRHDIRNNLQLVVAYAEMIDSPETPPETAYIQTILEAAQDAVDITTTARIVTEVMLQANDERHPVRLRSTLESELEDVQSNHTHAVITVDGTIPAVEVVADDMLESVFRNLLTNAIAHNDKELPEVTVSAVVDDGSVRIRIADNGPGIDDKHKQQIFEEGQQSPTSEGTGLGLYLVETLVDRYNGNVWVEDNTPTGSVFVVELPIRE